MRTTWHPHRYKHGKIRDPIDVETFLKLQERVSKIHVSSHTRKTVQGLLALLYWTGLRVREVLGRKAIKYNVKGGVKTGKAHSGLLKADMKITGGSLYVFCVDDKVFKHGKREAPLVLPLTLPYVDVIVELWKQTQPNRRVFPVSYITFWRICKRVDPKFTPHFFRHNRVTKFAANPKVSLAEICAWTGMTPQTVSSYMMRAGRFTKRTGQLLTEET